VVGCAAHSHPSHENAAHTCLLLVGRGSHDDSATAEMHEFARLRQQGLETAARQEPRPLVKVEVAFLAMAHPLLQKQLAKLVCQGYRRVIVQPHLLFYGELVESIERQVAEMAAGQPDTTWIVTPPLADLPGIVTRATESIQKVILDRCHEAGIRVVVLQGDD
jgi:sirohydrochlorin ferrochelatase